MKKTKVYLHSDARTLWPQSVSENEALMIEKLTPPNIFQATYQGITSLLAGSLFQKSWLDRQQLEVTEGELNQLYAIAQSWDTANTGNEKNASSAGVCIGIRPDYSIVVLDYISGWWEFPELIDNILQFAGKWHDNSGKYHELLIESKVSGQSAAQYLKQNAPHYFRRRIMAITPISDKETRAGIAAMWLRNGMIYLPQSAPWLEGFEKELLNFPNGRNKDGVDSFSQAVNWYENYLKQGYELRTGAGIYSQDYTGKRLTQKERILQNLKSGKVRQSFV